MFWYNILFNKELMKLLKYLLQYRFRDIIFIIIETFNIIYAG